MRLAGSRLKAAYLPLAQLAEQPDAWLASALGGACYVSAGRPPMLPDLPIINVDAPDLLAAEGMAEIWLTDEELQAGQRGDIRYRQSEHLLFGCLSREEATAGHAENPDVSPLQTLVEQAYREIFDLLRERGYSAVIRFWNYFPDINCESHGVERYRQFNIGRQDAFLAQGMSVIGNVPAACALGSGQGSVNIAFLAIRGEVSNIENPRQVSAYHYPNQYGPRSPTFSRAGLVRIEDRDALFISGTASIVGHETLHPGDVVAQTRESMNNIEAVVETARQRSPGAGFNLADLAYKVYVRHPDDLPSVKREIELYVGAPVRAVYLKADICRGDLLVEIEASAGLPVSFSGDDPS